MDNSPGEGAGGRATCELQAAREDRSLAADLIVSWGHGPAGHFGGNPAPGLWQMG